MKKYLCIRFYDAALIIDGDSVLERYEAKNGPVSKEERSSVIKSEILKLKSRPVDDSQLCNMLHCLFGFRPVGKFKATEREWVDKICSLVPGSYIRFDCIPFEETMHTHKPDYNSHQKLMKNENGAASSVWLTWRQMKDEFTGYDDLYNETIGLFNMLSGCDVREKFTVRQYIDEFKKFKGRPEVEEFLAKYVHDNEFMKANTGRGMKESLYPLKNGAALISMMILNGKIVDNTRHCSVFPFLNNNGITKKINYSGEIVVPVEDEGLLYCLKKYGKIPTILDGGYLKLKIKNVLPLGIDCDFMRFSDYKLDEKIYKPKS